MTAGGAQFQLLAANSQGQQAAEACSRIVERGPLAVSGCPLPDGRAGIPYLASVIGLGGSAPYFLSTAAGTLPAGLTLSANGEISGTPRDPGTYSFTLRLRDATQAATLQACRLTVAPAELRLTTPCPLPDGRAGEAYSTALQAEGGTPPYQFSFGPLPDGLTGSPAGLISGHPALLGGRSFNIGISDGAGRSAENACSIAVVNPQVPAISLVDPPATVPMANTATSITVQLASAYSAPVRGQVQLKITPDTGGLDLIVNSPDPLLGFAGGQRTPIFTVPAGATRVTLPLVSTGTVASTIALTLGNLEASGAPLLQYPATKFFRIAPAVPSMTSACYVRTNTEQGIQLDFQVTGVSNTRALTRAKVTIRGLAGVKPNLLVPAEFVFDGSDTLTAEINGVAEAYFASPANVRTGGAFTLILPVTLTQMAPSGKLESVQFVLFNAVGGSAVRSVAECQ